VARPTGCGGRARRADCPGASVHWRICCGRPMDQLALPVRPEKKGHRRAAQRSGRNARRAPRRGGGGVMRNAHHARPCTPRPSYNPRASMRLAWRDAPLPWQGRLVGKGALQRAVRQEATLDRPVGRRPRARPRRVGAQHAHSRRGDEGGAIALLVAARVAGVPIKRELVGRRAQEGLELWHQREPPMALSAPTASQGKSVRSTLIGRDIPGFPPPSEILAGLWLAAVWFFWPSLVARAQHPPHPRMKDAVGPPRPKPTALYQAVQDVVRIVTESKLVKVFKSTDLPPAARARPTRRSRRRRNRRWR